MPNVFIFVSSQGPEPGKGITRRLTSDGFLSPQVNEKILQSCTIYKAWTNENGQLMMRRLGFLLFASQKLRPILKGLFY